MLEIANAAVQLMTADDGKLSLSGLSAGQDIHIQISLVQSTALMSVKSGYAATCRN